MPPRGRGRRTPRTPTRPRPKPKVTTPTAIPQIYTPAVPAPAPVTPTGVPGGPGLSLPTQPTMTPTLQALYERQVGETAVAGPAIIPFGTTLTPYTQQQQKDVAEFMRAGQQWTRAKAENIRTERLQQIKDVDELIKTGIQLWRGKMMQQAPSPVVTTGAGYTRPSYGYRRSPVYRRSATAGGGRGRISSRTGLINWRIGL